MRKLTLFLFALVLLPAAQDRFDAMRQQLIANINASDAAAIEATFDQQMRAAVPEAKLQQTIGSIHAQFGDIVGVENTREPGPDVRVYRLRFERGALDMQLALDDAGKVAGLRLTPAAPAPGEAPKSHQTKLSLPFHGRWLVLWGGNTPETGGHHLDAPNQKYAFDLLGVGPDGQTHKGDGSRNEDYYAFGREILAPADGVVATVIRGVPDNRPGSMNPYSAVGNAVLITHRPGEVSVLAHLQQGSIRVKPGDRVKRGDVLALCGNSGNSSEPHLHYHLQNSKILQDGLGIPVHFDRVTVTHDGKTETKDDYSPVKGDIISAP